MTRFIYLFIDIYIQIRDIMAKTEERRKSNPVAFLLQLVGSLAYLWLVFGNGGALLQVGGAGAVWVPLFIGLATVTSIALFFVSFTNLLRIPLGAIVGMPVNAGAGVTLIALTTTSTVAGIGSVLYFIAVFGFVASLAEFVVFF